MFWTLATIIAAIAGAALFYASSGRMVNAGVARAETADDGFRLRLKAIEDDQQAGRLLAQEGEAARAELAREVLRWRKESAAIQLLLPLGRGVLLTCIASIGAIAFSTYAIIGNPSLPGQPLAERPEAAAASLDLEEAIVRIEAALARNPDDARGWWVIAPAYRERGRFADAANAYRRLIALEGPSAALETDLGEALMLAAGGVAAGEPAALFESAAARDPQDVRPRFYLAGEATRAGNYAEAIERWQQLIEGAGGDEPWLATAREGLAFAQGGGSGISAPLPPDAAAIEAMVERLQQRLDASGGSMAEWTQLVRSRIVLGQTDQAQASLDAARTAFPDPAQRSELEALAAGAGLR